MKFVLIGYRQQGDEEYLYRYSHGLDYYPVYKVKYISDDLIFGRE